MLDIFKDFKAYSRLKETRRKKVHVSEIIHDAGLLHFANEQEFQMPFPSRKRNLFPKQDQRLPATPQAQRCSLSLTVVAWKNVPVKTEVNNGINGVTRQQEIIPNNDGNTLLMNDLFASDEDGEDVEGNIGIMIKIKFRGQTFQMQLKETVCIPLQDILQDDSHVLLQNEEYVEIILFDCINVDLRHMGGYYNDEETRTTEFRYLVSISHYSLSKNSSLLSTNTQKRAVLQCQCPLCFTKEL